MVHLVHGACTGGAEDDGGCGGGRLNTCCVSSLLESLLHSSLDADDDSISVLSTHEAESSRPNELSTMPRKTREEIVEVDLMRSGLCSVRTRSCVRHSSSWAEYVDSAGSFTSSRAGHSIFAVAFRVFICMQQHPSRPAAHDSHPRPEALD